MEPQPLCMQHHGVSSIVYVCSIMESHPLSMYAASWSLIHRVRMQHHGVSSLAYACSIMESHPLYLQHHGVTAIVCVCSIMESHPFIKRKCVLQKRCSTVNTATRVSTNLTIIKKQQCITATDSSGTEASKAQHCECCDKGEYQFDH